MTSRYQAGVIIAGLCCSALAVFVIGPVWSTLSATTQTLGYFAGFVATLAFICWGSSLR